MIIGQNEGFRKLVGLMLEQNEDLLKGIIDTFKQLLDISPEKDQQPSGESTAPPKIGDLASISPDEIRSIIDLDKDESSPGVRLSRKAIVATKSETRPSYELLKRMSMEIKGPDDQPADLVAGRVSGSTKEAASPPAVHEKSRLTCVTLFKNYGSEKTGHPFEETKGDSVAEAMVIQGTLNTVCEILLTARRDMQIDLMLIIAKLLVKSAYNQAEFKYLSFRRDKRIGRSKDTSSWQLCSIRSGTGLTRRNEGTCGCACRS